jgi:hypothetical protein
VIFTKILSYALIPRKKRKEKKRKEKVMCIEDRGHKFKNLGAEKKNRNDKI